MEELFKYSAISNAKKIAAGEISKEDVSKSYKQRVDKYESLLNSFVSFFQEPVYEGGESDLSGVPIAIKDNICIEGKNITCASKILSNHVSVYDATVIKKLKSAGLMIAATTNMDEFAFGSSTETSCYGPVKNPWDIGCVVGGSSGGSAASVAARLVPFALGSDTGGSIRQPASLCGVVGLKPTYGRVSRYGLIAFGSSLDQIGPLTTNFDDCASLLNIICGPDENDSTSSVKAVPDFSKSLGADCKGLTVGVPQEYFQDGLDTQIKDAIEGVKEVFKNNGVVFKEINLPHTEYAVATYYIIGSSEASSNLQRFDGVKYGLRSACTNLKELYNKTREEGFGDEVKRRIFLGTYSLSSGYYDAYYVKALKVRRLIRNDFESAFSEVDVILTPTSPTAAFKIGEKTSDPLSMYLSDIYTISANLAGIPAVSFPCGFTKADLPIGAQLIAKDFDEETLIALGSLYQKNTDFHKRIPSLENLIKD
jgi:aspartyl-tRNA(Asn)/glutamyl-tRNA(Gln) amidotransferase subunit A